MTSEPMMYQSWQVTLQRFIDQGTANEKDLARFTLDLLNAAPDHPEIIRVVNAKTLQYLA